MTIKGDDANNTGWSNPSGRKVTAGRIRQLRKKRGLSQQALAHSANMHRTHLVRFEGGQVNLTLDAFFALACSLGVEPRELVPSLEELDCGNDD
ncbi:MAG: helix-turn-helix domain-containing protein [Myxococcota bacterium]